MKQENFEYLEKQVKFTGFGDGLKDQLKENMERGLPAFTLNHQQKFGKDETNSLLHFRYAESNGNYYFNSYDLSVKNAKGESQGNQKFYVAYDNTFTLKEAYNLMEGRSVNKNLVNKENEAYNAWVKLDFKDTDDRGNFKMRHFNENYGYNVEEALAKHPIKELNNDDDKKKLLDSLNKGNRQQVTFIRDNTEFKGFIEANPQYKTVTVYDQNMKRVNQSEKASESKDQSEKQVNKVTKKEGNEKAQDDGKKKKTRKVSIS